MTFDAQAKARNLHARISAFLLSDDLEKVAIILREVFNEGVAEGKAQCAPQSKNKVIETVIDGKRVWVLG